MVDEGANGIGKKDPILKDSARFGMVVGEDAEDFAGMVVCGWHFRQVALVGSARSVPDPVDWVDGSAGWPKRRVFHAAGDGADRLTEVSWQANSGGAKGASSG